MTSKPRFDTNGPKSLRAKKEPVHIKIRKDFIYLSMSC